MTALNDLAAAALLGSERRAPSPPTAGGDGALAAALQALPWREDPPQALLSAAAMVLVHDRAGRRPPTLARGDHPGPAPAEDAPECSPAAASLLERLMSDVDAEPVIAEWLARVAARGERPPATELPRLLDRATRASHMRPLVMAAGRRRAAWLAAQNDAWRWLASTGADDADDSGAIWRTGSPVAREALLADVRRWDASGGRQLLESTWHEDSAELRARFLAALRERLESDDEELLERALDDRSKGVRSAAAALLAALPTSAYRERMAARLRALVRVEGRLRRRLLVELPGDPDAAALRDGAGTGAHSGLGRRASFLADIVAGAGLEEWATLAPAPLTPAEWLHLARKHEHWAALIQGWRLAAQRQDDLEWRLALAAELGDVSLLDGLTSTVGQPVAIGLVRAAKDRASIALLAAMAGPWGPELSVAAVDRIATVRISRAELVLIGHRLDPAAFGSARALADRVMPTPNVQALMHVLDLREELITELPTP